MVLVLNIHSFNNRDIGKPQDYLEDISFFKTFIERVDSYLPYFKDEFYKYKGLS